MNMKNRFIQLRSELALAGILLAVASAGGIGWHAARAQDLDDKGIGGILDDIHQDANDTWWNKDWKYRRKVTVNDPKVLEDAEKALTLPEPEPLLLYNTGRCADKLADLRVVGADGQTVPCGVIGFGRDDGSSQIWCKPPIREGQKSLEFFVYYGNPNAAATGDALPEAGSLSGDPQFVLISPEQVPEGAAPHAAESGSFFKDLVVAEAEDFTATGKAAAARHAAWAFAPAQENEAAKLPVESQPLEGASGEEYVVPKAGATLPATVWRDVQVPAAGAWSIHVRYLTKDKKRSYGAFKLLAGTREFDCGTEGQVAGGDFRWQSFAADLPQGELKLGLRYTGQAAPDVVVLTRDAHYRPDVRDINGPAWFRFKVTTPNITPFYVDLFNYIATTTVNGPQGKTTAYLFKNRCVLPKRGMYTTDNHGFIYTSELPPYLKKMPADLNNLLKPGDWSPWGVTMPHGSYTWYTQIRFMAGGKAYPESIKNLTSDMEFATRNDITRIFHATSAATAATNNLQIHMAPAIDLATLRRDTLTFDEWARQRFELTKSLGFKGGEGPKKIIACTIANSRSEEEAGIILQQLDWLGLNTVTFQTIGISPDPILEKSPINSFWTYFRTEYKFEKYFYDIDPKEKVMSITGVEEPKMTPKGPFAGMTCGQTVEKICFEASDAYIKKSVESAKGYMPFQMAHMRYNDLDDEIGAAVDGRTINAHPLFHGFFVEYLKGHGLQPALFGAKTWDEVQAVDYSELGANQKRLEQLAKDAEAAQKKLEQDSEAPLDGKGVGSLDDAVKENEKKQKEREKREKAGLPAEERPAPTSTEKRAFYWTQRFRSYYTAMFYRAKTTAIHKYFPPGIVTCANMQASPIQAGRMWDGSLNIWDLGRDKAFSAMQLEDWHNSIVNINFGMAMERAAARKNGQPLTALVVGSNVGNRIMADLMQGARQFLFYLYGPVQGDPAFAEDRETQRQLGQMMRQIARAESDILAAKHRQSDVAILVDNASETNGDYFPYPFDHDRMAVYAALNDAQIPVELVGEREVLEDEALNRYKVLYVCEPHVHTKVQEKIKAWVAAGGTLWADYAGLARNEYDDPSTLMDEVLGLKKRGPLTPYLTRPFSGKLPAPVTVNVPKGDLLNADTIAEIRYSALLEPASPPPSYEVSTGKVLATFADGKPAIIRNKFGKGDVLFCGFLGGIAYGGQWTPHGYNFSRIAREAPATPLRGQLMTAIAKTSGIVPHTKIDEHMFWTNVHDGPGQTLVYMINGAHDLKGKPLEVLLPKAPKSAYLASGKPVTYKMDGLRATLPISLPPNECDIVVFKY